ncbi:hypothetical protein GF342_02460 [Candidatus Woesearchaeota archaeon]|nr:hypothetical protein [Candidatus Woesearchaeota archaeon]
MFINAAWPSPLMQEQLFSLLVDKDDISWRSLIHDLVRSQKMDPWDVNVTTLSKMYIDRVRQMQKMDLKISGKVVLAAAILLKIKSKKLLGEDLLEFDRLLATQEPDETEFYEELAQETAVAARTVTDREEFPIYPRTPQMRKRKVSVFDLLNALEKALEVKNRRENRLQAVTVERPDKKVDIGTVLKSLFSKLKNLFKGKEKISFEQLLDKNDRDERVKTFIPLLYLCNEQKVRLEQQGHCEEITILPGVSAC